MHLMLIISLASLCLVLNAQNNPYCYRTYKDPCYGAEPNDYKEGDSILPALPDGSRKKRGATADKRFLWPDAKVYYNIADGYTEKEKNTILAAMHHIENQTCVRFEQNKAHSEGYINIFPGVSCCSYIGYIGCGEQGVSLAHGCINAGTIIHEILHSMGFYHEHSRPDRDQYVRVIDENIRSGGEQNFDKLGTDSINSLGIEYDYNSIMHYCENSFSVSQNKKTILLLDPNATVCGGCELSTLDILQINLLYNCDINNLPPISTALPPKPPLPSLNLPYSKCGYVFDRKRKGKFSSPHFNEGIYPHNQKCGWVFRAPKGFTLSLKVTVSIEFSSGCTKDYLQGRYSSFSTRKYCGEYTLSFSKITEFTLHLITDKTNGPSSRTYKGITGTFSSKDINECSSSRCSHGCVNTVGSYHCTCPKGLYLSSCNDRCLDVNECVQGEHDCDLTTSVCKNNYGSYSCECKHGYIQLPDKKTCFKEFDVSCSVNNGGCSQICNETEGSASVVCSCRSGYILDSDKTNCKDINECTTSTHGCQQICNNIEGSYQCGCSDGFKLSENQHSCQDIDECKTLSEDTYCQDVCYNSDGSYFCFCGFKRGFGYGPQFKYCTDNNECANGNGGCEQTCTNTIGSFECSCSDGYILTTDKRTCQDIDECSLDNGGCDQVCNNTLGSHECSCNKGYELDNNRRLCQDINECNFNNGGCNQHDCINVNGSFECVCNEGFELDSNRRFCQDIDECSLGNGGCDQVCNNTLGSHECSCNEGYELGNNGKLCQDINECNFNNGGCNHDCINAVGSFECVCNEGYELGSNKEFCQDIDECQSNNGGCEQTCMNTNGSYFCSCEEGYRVKSNKACEDIDECEENEYCSHLCNNTLGSFKCSCPSDYILSTDERVCSKISTTSASMYKLTSLLPTTPSIPLTTPSPTSTPSVPCGGNLTKDSGTIAVNNSVSGDCTWIVKLQDQSKYLSFAIESMNFVPKDDNCSGCYVEMFNGGSTKGALLGKYCKTGDEKLQSAINEVVIHYHSSAKCTGTFELSYTSGSKKRGITPCIAIIYPRPGSTQLISSKNFPSLHSAGEDCSIYIFAYGRKIRFTLLYIDESDDCSQANIKYYSLFNPVEANLVSTICNPSSKVVLQSINYGLLSYTNNYASRGYLGKIDVI